MADCYVQIADELNIPLTSFYRGQITISPNNLLNNFQLNTSTLYIDVEYADSDFLETVYASRPMYGQFGIKRNLVIKPYPDAETYNVVKRTFLTNWRYGNLELNSLRVETTWIFTNSAVVFNGEEVPVALRRMPLVVQDQTDNWDGPTIMCREGDDPTDWLQEGF